MATNRVRWSVALATSLALPLLLGVVTAVVVRPAWMGALLGQVLACSFTAPALARVRGRTLTISDSGLLLQRDKYVLSAPWDSITGVERRKVWGVIPVEELTLSSGELIARGSRGNTAPTPEALAKDPAARRIQISFYDEHWRDGPVGDHLRRLGLDSD